ncbi:MAG TPA: tetratricopeptide repeat protein [bacterium]
MATDKGSGAAGAASAEIGKYLEILAKDPNSRVFAPLAEAYRKAGLLDDAIETAREGLNVHPNYLGGRVALGRALFEKKSFGEAAEEMRKVVKAAADNIIAHKVLGQIALAQGALPDAAKAFRMVVLLDPHDQEAKKALADIGAGVVPPPQAAPPPAPVAAAPPVPKVAPATAPAPAPSPTVPPPPAEASPWGELALEGLDSHRVELEEPRPQPPPATKPEAITLDDIGVEPPPIDLEDIEPAAAPPSPLPDIPLPASEPAEPPAEIEIFGREPAVPPAEPAPPPAAPVPEAESPFEVFGRQKALRPGETARDEREAYADIDLEAAAPAPEPQQAPERGQDEEQDGVFEIFTREPRPRDAAAVRPAHEDRPVLEQLELEPTAHLPLEQPEGEPPVIELHEEIPRIDVQSELELALAEERDADAAPAPEPGPPTVGEEIGWEDDSPVQDVAGPREEESAVPVLSPEEAATEELVWEEPAAPAEPPPPAATEAVEALAAAAAPECAPTEELPIPLDAGPGVELPGDWDDAAPAALLAEEAPAPEPETAWLESPVDLSALEPPPAEPAAQAGDIEASSAETVVSLEEEIPSVDLAGEIGPEASFAEDIEEAGKVAPEAVAPAAASAVADEVVPEPTAEPTTEPVAETAAEPVAEPAETAGAAPAAAGTSSAARGVFDTETLASIYINQGFYGRAAAIYERLATASPDDAALRRKLDEVRALERAQGATAAAEPAAPATGGRPDRAETIRRLEALLAAFRGGRPR